MAYVANTAFRPLVTNRANDETLNITGKFQASSADAICSAGTICVKTTQLPNEGYTGVNNENAWVMNVATALANAPVYACNTYEVNEIADPVTGARYRVGANTLGLPAQAGQRVTFTRIAFGEGKIYRFGAGNFTTAPSTTKIYITVDDGFLEASDTAPSSGDKYFKVVGSGTFTQGAYAGFGYYDLEACIY